MSNSETLWGDQLAPVTSEIGFLRAPLNTVADALVNWRRRIHGAANSEHLDGGLWECAPLLEPLTSGVRPRELLVATANPEWTATFDCGVQGGDPVSLVGHLSQVLKVHGVVTASIPDVKGTADVPERYGARQFQLFGPLATEFLNYVRTVSVVRDGSGWRFDAAGTVQAFEEVEAYRRRKVADRFTPEMLSRYAAEFGLRLFDPRFYPGPSVLIRNPTVPLATNLVLTLKEAQRRAGITPVPMPR